MIPTPKSILCSLVNPTMEVAAEAKIAGKKACLHITARLSLFPKELLLMIFAELANVKAEINAIDKIKP